MQNKKTSFFQDLPKFVIMQCLIAGIGAVIGIMFYLVKYESELRPQPIIKDVQGREAADISADWKVYENKKYGFTMKYPSGWEFSEEENHNNGDKGVTFNYIDQDDRSSRVGIAWMSSYDQYNERNINFEEMVGYFKKMAKESEAEQYVKGEVKTIINDIPAYNMIASKDERYMDSNFMIVNNEVLVIACESENLDNNVCESTFKEMLSSFKFIERSKAAFLGIRYKDVSTLSEDEKNKIGLPQELEYGALIVSKDLGEELNRNLKEAESGIVSGSPAESAGLRGKDVILEINGEEVLGLVKLVEKYLPGDKIKLKILRDGEYLEQEVTLAEFPELINQ